MGKIRLKPLSFVIGCLAFVLFAGQGALSGDVWTECTPFAGKVFNNGLDLKNRSENYSAMMDLLYRADLETRLVYVDSRAMGFADGGSWLNAFNTIQNALDAMDETGGWIWVAEGEYHESFRLKSRICLFGGFSGVEQELRDRDISRHPSVLTGDYTKSVVYMESHTILDGFVIQNGGGEMGGGVYTGGWLSIIRNNTFRDNTVSWAGGGICVNGEALVNGSIGENNIHAPIIERNLIFHNSGYCGSGIANHYTASLILSNTIANNYGGERARGIEIYMRNSTAPTILNSIFWNNLDDIYYQLFVEGCTSPGIFKYNCVEDFDDTGEGIIHDNPSFIDTTQGNFRLRSGSPCVHAGMPDLFPDPDKSRGDLGAFCAYLRLSGAVTPVTFLSEPIAGVTVNLESNMVPTPASMAWRPGTLHSIGAVEFHRVSQGTAYVFDGWTDGDERFREIPGESTPKTYTARYRLRHRLEITNEPDGVLVRGEGWHDPDSIVTVSVDPVSETGDGIRHVFQSWEGLGAGSYSGGSPLFQAVVSGPVLQKLHTLEEYRLTTVQSPDSAADCSITADPAGPWHPAGGTVTLRAESRNPRFSFLGWSKGVPNPDGSVTLVMNNPDTVKGCFQYLPHPPGILDLPDTLIQKNGSLSLSFDWLNRHVQDAADSSASLRLTFLDNPDIRIVPDSSERFFNFIPTPGWTGNAQVVCRVEDPTGAADQDTFKITVQPFPVILSFHPTGGSAGNEVAISGFNLDGIVAVNFGNTPVEDFVVDSDSLIRVKVPAESSTGIIQVLTPYGTASSPRVFTVNTMMNVQYEFRQSGWNLISLPVIPQDSAVDALFPTARGKIAFHWEPDSGVYAASSVMRPRIGYWICLPGAVSVTIAGLTVAEYTTRLECEGWHMIGGTKGGSDLTNPADDPDGRTLSPVFVWDTASGSYADTTILNETEGGWLAVLGACELTVRGFTWEEAVSGHEGWESFSAVHGSVPPSPPVVNWDSGIEAAIPSKFEAFPNYPNPFNPETTFEYRLPERVPVTIVIFNTTGQAVRRLIDQTQEPGSHRASWDGKDGNGRNLGSGLYLAYLRAGQFSSRMKILLVR